MTDRPVPLGQPILLLGAGGGEGMNDTDRLAEIRERFTANYHTLPAVAWQDIAWLIGEVGRLGSVSDTTMRLNVPTVPLWRGP